MALLSIGGIKKRHISRGNKDTGNCHVINKYEMIAQRRLKLERRRIETEIRQISELTRITVTLQPEKLHRFQVELKKSRI